MEPTILERGPTMLAGMVFYGDPFAGGEGWSQENEIGRCVFQVGQRIFRSGKTGDAVVLPQGQRDTVADGGFIIDDKQVVADGAHIGPSATGSVIVNAAPPH